MNNDLATHIARESAALSLTKKIMNINSSRHQYIFYIKFEIIYYLFFFLFDEKKKKKRRKKELE